jgi:hypothetical protein
MLRFASEEFFHGSWVVDVIVSAWTVGGGGSVSGKKSQGYVHWDNNRVAGGCERRVALFPFDRRILVAGEGAGGKIWC